MGWSQVELGKKLGKESSSVSSYESGTRTLKIADLPRLAELLNVSITYFFGEDESVEDIITVVRQLDKADRRFVLSYAERFLEMQKLQPGDFWDNSLLTLEKRFEDGKWGHIKV